MPIPSQFLPALLPKEPLSLAAKWLEIAQEERSQPNPNAMVLASVAANGQPSARVVLCKEICIETGYISFFTNYRSHKGREIDGNSRVALVLHWDHLHRQVRIEGHALRAPDEESDAYFNTRPWQRRIGAWASAQSTAIGSHAELKTAVAATAHRFGTPVPGPEDEPTKIGIDYQIPRPADWGGYHVYAEAVELWVEGESRIHDRARWTRSLTFTLNNTGKITSAPITGPWSVTRLQP